MGHTVGPRQTFGPSTIPSATPLVIAIPQSAGARAVILQLSGGANANALATVLVENAWVASASAAYGETFTVVPVAGSILSNGTRNGTAGVVIIFPTSPSTAQPIIATPFVRISLTAATGDITGVTIDAWVVLDTPSVGTMQAN